MIFSTLFRRIFQKIIDWYNRQSERKQALLIGLGILLLMSTFSTTAFAIFVIIVSIWITVYKIDDSVNRAKKFPKQIVSTAKDTAVVINVLYKSIKEAPTTIRQIIHSLRSKKTTRKGVKK